MQVYNQNKNCLAEKVILANTFFSRLRGLMGKSMLEQGCCLLLKPCCSVHTLFMRFSIDVLFLDVNGKIVHHATMPPFRFSPWVREAKIVLEFPAGTLADTDTSKGDWITFSQRSDL